MRMEQESLKKPKIFYFRHLQTVIHYIKDYYNQANKPLVLLISLFTAIMVFLNYHFRLDDSIRNNPFPVKLFLWYGVFAPSFLVPYLFTSLLQKGTYIKDERFLLLALLAPLIFSIKMTSGFHFQFSSDAGWNSYWNQVAYWPQLVLIIFTVLYIIWKTTDRQQPFYGMVTKAVKWKPYWLMLLIMVPLIAAAATQKDFQEVYPKLQSVQGLISDGQLSWWHQLLFELSYGTDFITIEFFFRGFLVLAFVKWAGKDAILPMACFYCSIHFGKPLGECISSYFGGILLGIIVYNTRSVWGGLIVHLGIAWLMELAGSV